MELKILTIGDPHFKVSNVVESEEMVKKILQISQEKKPDFIVCLGDILNNHENIHVVPLSSSIDFLYKLSQNFPLFVIIGNHDRPNNSDFLSQKHPFTSLAMWNNTTIIDRTKVFYFKEKFKFIFVPYVFPGKFYNALYFLKDPKIIEKKKENIINDNDIKEILKDTTAVFAHQEFFSAKLGPIISQCGDKWPTNYPLIISGHIHDYQRIQNNIVYTGSPMQHAFGDRDDKTISFFTFKLDDKNNMTWEEERIDLQLTKKIIEYLSPDEILTYIPPENKQIKIVISGSSAEIKATMKLLYVKELEKKGIKIVYKTIPNSSDTVLENSATNNFLVTSKLSYLQKLYQKIELMEGQKYWFEQLFGVIESFPSTNQLNLASSLHFPSTAQGSPILEHSHPVPFSQQNASSECLEPALQDKSKKIKIIIKK